MPAPVAVLVEVDGEPVFQAYIAYCAICRGPCRGAPPPKVAYAKPRKKKTGSLLWDEQLEAEAQVGL